MKRVRKLISGIFIVTLILSVTTLGCYDQAFAAASKTTVSARELNNGLQCTFVDMPYSGAYSRVKTYKGKSLQFSAMQNFEFTPDKKYIFTTSKCFTGSTMHTLLTRCSFPDNPGKDAEAICRDAIVLGNYGHGEVLAITQDNPNLEVYNLWVGCTPEKKHDGHATAIARLTYKVNANGKGSIVKTVKITGFKKANTKKGKATYFKDKVSPMWVIAAVDKDSNQIVFRLRFKQGYGCTYLSYKFDKLNKALDKVKNNKSYKIQKAAKWQIARVKYSQSIQSFDVDGNKLYVAAGEMGKNATVYVMPYKIQKSKKVKDQKRENKHLSQIINIVPEITVKGVKYTKKDLELEGIKVMKDPNTGKMNYYINFFKKGTGLRDTMTLYKFQR